MELSYNAIAALNAMNPQNYVEFEDIHGSTGRNPENMTITKDLFEKTLSSDAKMVVRLIIETPDDICPIGSHGDLSWTKVRSFFGKRQLNRRKMEKIRKEIRRWLEEKS